MIKIKYILTKSLPNGWCIHCKKYTKGYVQYIDKESDIVRLLCSMCMIRYNSLTVNGGTSWIDALELVITEAPTLIELITRCELV